MKRHHTHILLIALLTALAGTVRAQQLVDGWKKVATGAQGNLYDICCIDDQQIWVCAQDGGLLKSSDGGETWVRKHTEEGFAMSRIKFANENVGYAMGVSSLDHQNMVLLKTIDAGETWARVADTALDAVADGRGECMTGDWQLIGTDTLYFFESPCTICGRANLFRSTDGGHSFHDFRDELPYESTREYLYAQPIGFHFEDNEGYCVYGIDDVLRAFRTTDYGQTWTRHTLFESDYSWASGVSKIHVINKLEARLFTPFGYLDTHDGFATAILMHEYSYFCYPTSIDYPTDLKFTDDRHGCVTGPLEIAIKDIYDYPAGYAVITNDGGEHWELPIMNGMESGPAFAVDGVDTVFYVTSDHGIVYKRDLIPQQSVIENGTPDGITLSPTLTDGIVTLSGVKLREVTVYNTLGQQVFSQKEETDRMTLDLTSQSAGLYFVSVTTPNGQHCVKKVVKQ